jgi:hypothetical protein
MSNSNPHFSCPWDGSRDPGFLEGGKMPIFRMFLSDLFVAQMIGHSSPSIVQTYAKAIDEHRRDAIRKLSSL